MTKGKILLRPGVVFEKDGKIDVSLDQETPVPNKAAEHEQGDSN